MREIKIQCKYDELIDLDRLVKHPKNPNDHGLDQIERLAELMLEHDWRHPIIISKLSGYIVAGHGRLMAAHKIGMKQVPVVYQDFKDEAHEYAFVVSDNAIALWAELDLAKINQDFLDLGPDLDVKFLGLHDFKIETAELPNLESGDPDFQQMTFILSNDQVDIVKRAIEKASKTFSGNDGINQNRNGNLIAEVCQTYVLA